MAGKYCKLDAKRDFLLSVDELDQRTAETCESEATTRIDTALEGWDRSLWGPSSCPREVVAIALRIASALYFRVKYAQTAPEKGDALQFPRRLESEAQERLKEIQGRGYVMGDDGERIEPIDPQDAGSMFVEVMR